MDLTAVTVVFLIVAVLVALGILVAAARPHLRVRDDRAQDRGRGHGQEHGAGSRTDHRHRSRTG